MKTYTLKLHLVSPALIGSGEGFEAIIDTDIVFDDVGIPFVPAKRIKGCLLDSAQEVLEMCDLAQIELPFCLEKSIIQTFGKTGDVQSAPVYFSNLTIEQYDQNQAWLKYLLSQEEYQAILSKDRILETFTDIRQQTRIDLSGVADDGSLRTIRLIKKDTTFFGNVVMGNDDEHALTTLILACSNVRHIGTKRNRGFGEVHCSLLDGDHELPIPKQLEDVWTQ